MFKKNSTEGDVTSMNDEKKNEIRKALRTGNHSFEKIAELENVTVDQIDEVLKEWSEEESPHE